MVDGFVFTPSHFDHFLQKRSLKNMNGYNWICFAIRAISDKKVTSRSPMLQIYKFLAKLEQTMSGLKEKSMS
jgi:hypothetical protein